jgi:hypothetical protein
VLGAATGWSRLPSGLPGSKGQNLVNSWRFEMQSCTDLFGEVLETPDLDDLLTERDLELLRAAEAHHRRELLHGQSLTVDYSEQHWNA